MLSAPGGRDASGVVQVYPTDQDRSGGAEGTVTTAKLHLSTIPAADLARAVETGATIEAVLDLTDARGGPLCASVRPPWLRWSVV